MVLLLTKALPQFNDRRTYTQNVMKNLNQNVCVISQMIALHNKGFGLFRKRFVFNRKSLRYDAKV